MDTVEVEVVRLQERFNTLDARTTDIQKDMKEQNKKLDLLVAMHNQRKGAQAAMKLFMALGGSSGFAAGIAALWEHWGK